MEVNVDTSLLLVNYYWLHRDFQALALHYHLARTYGKEAREKFLECHCSYCRDGHGMHSVGLEEALGVIAVSIQTNPIGTMNAN